MPASNGLIPTPGQTARMPRTTFQRSVPGGASINYGRIYPVFMKYQEANSALLGFNPSSLIRGQTQIAPPMGNSQLELHAFAVPWRIIWNYTKQFFGENDTDAWTQQNNYTKPQIKLAVGDVYVIPNDFLSTGDVNECSSTNTNFPYSGSDYTNGDFDLIKIADLGTSFVAGGVNYTDANGLSLVVNCCTSDIYGPNKLADYLGIHPVPKNAEKPFLKRFFESYLSAVAAGEVFKISVDALPFRAFFSIVNYYYRDQNYQAPYLFTKDNSDLKLFVVKTPSGNPPSGTLPMPYDFMKYRACGQWSKMRAGVTYMLEGSAFCPPASRFRDPFSTIVPEPLKGNQYDLLSLTGLAPVGGYGNDFHLGDGSHFIMFGDDNKRAISGNLSVTANGYFQTDDSTTGTGVKGVSSSNLFADLTQSAGITLEKFRDFVVLNQWNEKAVKGTRYAEILSEFYGVPVDPALLDEPKFLGGIKLPIASWQVTQSAPNSDGSGVGDLASFTHSRYDSKLADYFFKEPSIFMVIAVARVEHTFAQQIDPHWFRKDKFDEHYPLFDGLGYQPMDKRIPYLPFGVVKDNNSSDTESPVLGFQESYWEERYQLGNVSGVLNASNPYSLDYYFYNELPTENPVGGPEYLSAYRDAEIVDKTLQIGSEASKLAQQLLLHFTWNYTEAKNISARMDPGLTRI